MEENKSKDADFDFEIEECTEEKVKDEVNEKFEVEDNSAEKNKKERGQGSYDELHFIPCKRNKPRQHLRTYRSGLHYGLRHRQNVKFCSW